MSSLCTTFSVWNPILRRQVSYISSNYTRSPDESQLPLDSSNSISRLINIWLIDKFVLKLLLVFSTEIIFDQGINRSWIVVLSYHYNPRNTSKSRDILCNALLFLRIQKNFWYFIESYEVSYNLQKFIKSLEYPLKFLNPMVKFFVKKYYFTEFKQISYKN